MKGKLVNGVGSQYSHTTSERAVSSITTADAHTTAASSRLNWRPCRFKWTRPFRRKTKSDFCACAITFQTRYIKELFTIKPNIITTSLLEAEFVWNMHWRMASVRYKLLCFREAYYNTRKYVQITRTGCVVVTGQGPDFEYRTRQPRRWEDTLVVRHWLDYIERGEVKFVLVCTNAPTRLYE